MVRGVEIEMESCLYVAYRVTACGDDVQSRLFFVYDREDYASKDIISSKKTFSSIANFDNISKYPGTYSIGFIIVLE